MNNSLQTVVAKLEALFEAFNIKFFNSELETPVITVSPDDTKGAYGWFTVAKVWKREGKEDEAYHEINICAESLARPFSEICETLLHEMVHLYCNQHDIKDTSRNGSYHNMKYKEEAERHGLIAEKSDTYGWTFTKLNAESTSFISGMNQNVFDLYRKKPVKIASSSSKSSSRKYVCPECGLSVRATKDVRIICADCDCEMEKEE